MFSGLTIALLLTGQMPSGSGPADKPTKREQMRYDGRSFEEWREDLRTELKEARRVEGLKAMRAFAANGYATEAVSVTIEVMALYYSEHGYLLRESQDLDAIAQNVLWMNEEASRPALLAALKGGQRNQQLYVLEHLGTDFQFAVPVLRDLAVRADEEVSEKALALMAHSKVPELLAFLDKLYRDGAPKLRCRVINAHWNSRDDSAYRPLLLRAMKDKEPVVRACAVDCLRGYQDWNGVTKAIIAALDDESLEVRKKAIDVVRCPNLLSRAAPRLRKLLGSENAEERELAAEALRFFRE